MKKTGNQSSIKQVKLGRTTGFQTLNLHECAKITGGSEDNNPPPPEGEKIDEKV